MTPGETCFLVLHPNSTIPLSDCIAEYQEAYERAAQAVLDAHEAATSQHAAAAGAIAGVLEEIIETGHLPYHMEMRASAALRKFQGAPADPPPIDDTTKTADAPTGRSGALSRQVDGDHYHLASIQPWDIWEAYQLDPWEANALKYLLRRKRGVSRVSDLRKCAHYIERCIERELEREV